MLFRSPFPTIRSRIRLPFLGWALIGRLVAPFSKRIQAEIKDANERITILLNQLTFEQQEHERREESLQQTLAIEECPILTKRQQFTTEDRHDD